MNQRKLLGAALLCVFLAIFLVGCNKIELYSSLSEEDANEILVILQQNGIKAIKNKDVKQNETSFSIDVQSTDIAKARTILKENNLPRVKVPSLVDTYKNQGLIPTPDEQKGRYQLALQGEVTNALRSIPEVVSANVILNMPTQDQFDNAETKHEKRPTASVTIRIKPDPSGLTSMTEAKIQQFVANTVQGMNPRDVAVVMTFLPVENKVLRPGDVQTLPLQPPSSQPLQPGQQPGFSLPLATQHELIGLKLDAESKDRLKVYLLIFFVLFIVLSFALIIIIVQGSRMRRTLATLQGSAGGNRPAIEGQVMDDGPPQLGDGPPV